MDASGGKRNQRMGVGLRESLRSNQNWCEGHKGGWGQSGTLAGSKAKGPETLKL